MKTEINFKTTKFLIESTPALIRITNIMEDVRDIKRIHLEVSYNYKTNLSGTKKVLSLNEMKLRWYEGCPYPSRIVRVYTKEA